MNALKLKLAKKNKEIKPESYNELYEKLVESKIRNKYSVNQELAILRQRTSKPDEFTNYYSYVELCKAEAKAELEINK